MGEEGGGMGEERGLRRKVRIIRENTNKPQSKTKFHKSESAQSNSG